MNHSDCCSEMLVRSEVGQVALCQGCGQVHLALNFLTLTLRFDAQAFRTLVSMVSQAQSRLDGVAETEVAVVPAAAISALH